MDNTDELLKSLRLTIEEEFKAVVDFANNKLIGIDVAQGGGGDGDSRLQRIASTLADHGVAPQDMAPPTPGDISLFKHFLPIHYFEEDASDQFKTLECSIRRRNAEQKSAVVAGLFPVLSEDGTVYYDWQYLSTLRCEPASRLWDVATLDGTTGTLSSVYLIFEEDSIKECTARIKMAMKKRNVVEAQVRAVVVAAHVPLQYLPSPPPARVTAIDRRIGNDITAKEQVVAWLKQCFAENMLLHSLPELRGQGLTFEPLRVDSLGLPSPPPVQPDPNYALHRGLVQKTWLYSIDESHRAMMDVTVACSLLASLNFFNVTEMSKMNIDSFKMEVDTTTVTVLKYLRQDWTGNIVMHINRHLKKVKKGWFWLEQGDPFIYDVSKLTRFMNLVKLKMESALFQLTLTSVRSVAQLITGLCQVFHMDAAGRDFKWGGDLRTSNFIACSPPLFAIRMVIEDGIIKYADCLDTFKHAILDKIDFAVVSSHDIQQVHPRVLPNLRFPVLKLCSIGLMSPDIQTCGAVIAESLDVAATVLQSYLTAYEPFQELAQVDVKTFVQAFSEQNENGEAYSTEINEQNQVYQALDAAIPTQITIGPFQVITEDVKNCLNKKQQDIIDSLKRALFQIVHGNCLKAMEHFSEIEFRLVEKLSNIEDAVATKEWMVTVPADIHAWDPHIQEITKGFEILEDIEYPIEDEFAKQYWTTRGLAVKTLRTLQNSQERIKLDIERFHAAFLQDEEKYQTCLTDLHDLITMFLDNLTTERKSIMDVEAGKIWRAMELNLKLEAILKSRAAIFKFDETLINGQMEELMNIFKPHVPDKFLQ